MKYCIIRRVSFRMPGTDRSVWANVVSENNHLALLFVPSTQVDGSHLIVLAQEDARGVFESVGSPPFEIGSSEVKLIGNTFRAFGKELRKGAFRNALNDLLSGGPEVDI